MLENASHGPQICFIVLTSLPPQGSGLPLHDWDWDAVEGVESMAGTTWVNASVTGTYDGEALTVTAAGGPEPRPAYVPRGPLCDDFDRSATRERPSATFHGIPGVAATWTCTPGPSWDGPCVVNIVAQPGHGDTVHRVARARWSGALCIVERDQPRPGQLIAIQREVMASPLKVFGSHPDPPRGAVIAAVVLADDAAIAYARDRWGDTVILESLLEPVTS